MNNQYIASICPAPLAPVGIAIADIAEMIRKRREALGMTQEALAAQCQCTRQAIARIEQGRTTLNLEKLIKVTQALHLKVKIALEPKETVNGRVTEVAP